MTRFRQKIASGGQPATFKIYQMKTQGGLDELEFLEGHHFLGVVLFKPLFFY